MTINSAANKVLQKTDLEIVYISDKAITFGYTRYRGIEWGSNNSFKKEYSISRSGYVRKMNHCQDCWYQRNPVIRLNPVPGDYPRRVSRMMLPPEECADIIIKDWQKKENK